jgi:CRP-like cAMP-binding protein
MKKDTTDYQTYFEILKNSNSFSKLSNDILHEMLGMFYVETWSKGQLKFYDDKTFHNFYFIVSGRIKMYQIHPEKGSEFTLNINTTGDFFDVISLLDEKRHHIEMEALDDILLLSASANIVREWIMKHAEFNKVFLPYVAKQLRQMEEKACNLVFFDTWTRTLKLFIKHLNEKTHNAELKLINNLTHNEIASIIGTSKNIINLHIQELKKKGVIEVKRHHIIIKKYEELLRLLPKK